MCLDDPMETVSYPQPAKAARCILCNGTGIHNVSDWEKLRSEIKKLYDVTGMEILTTDADPECPHCKGIGYIRVGDES